LHDACPNLFRLRIKTTHSYEENMSVPTKSDLGLFGLWHPLVGTALTEALDHQKSLPAGVIDFSV
jgi:hypothetical protein